MKAEAGDTEQSTYDSRRLRHRNDWCAVHLNIVKTIVSGRVRRAIQSKAKRKRRRIIRPSQQEE